MNTMNVTIKSGESLSDGVNFYGERLTGLVMPAAWTTAGITFQGSIDGVTWCDLHNPDGEIVLASPAASKMYALTISNYMPCKFIRLRSGLASAAVNQLADRTITLIVENYV